MLSRAFFAVRLAVSAATMYLKIINLLRFLFLFFYIGKLYVHPVGLDQMTSPSILLLQREEVSL